VSEGAVTYDRVDDYQARRLRAYQAVRRLKLRRAWIAGRIGRSARCVTEVLRGTDTGAPTLLLVEGLLERIESGEVVVPEEAISRPGRPRAEGVGSESLSEGVG
jgi:hypothetical protein